MNHGDINSLDIRGGKCLKGQEMLRSKNRNYRLQNKRKKPKNKTVSKR